MTSLLTRFPSSVRTILLTAFFVFAPVAVSLNAAQAQTLDLSTDEVTIDLSVIDNPGAAPASAPYVVPSRTSAPRLGLMLPGSKAPISRLHVAVPKATGRIKLRKPGSKPRKAAKRVAKKTKKKARIKQAKITKPAPPVVAAIKPPAPLSSAPPAAPVVTPAPVKQKTAKVATKKPALKTPEPPKAAPVRKEQATLPPSAEITDTGKTLRVEFAATASKFPAKAKTGLQALAKKLKGKDNLRLQLMAYAGGKSLSASKSRRLSLSRALSVRSFLMQSGVRSTRIDVRALGSKATEKPLNRVDVNIIER
jgi:outer membrane protein OmpA-like peptidoglycan-associated protein